MNECVEILLAVYNGEQYLPEQLDSILAQSDGRWHLTVSDDGSEDASPEIIADYARRYPERIGVRPPGRRFGSARDHFFALMAACDAEYMLFCDQDDVWYPDKVKRTRAALVEATARWGPDAPVLVFSDQTPTDAALTPLAPSLMRYQGQYFETFDYRSILMQNVVTGGAMGVNRALARLGCPRGDASGIIMHDWWLAATAARFGHIVYIDEPLGAYRQHVDNAVGAKNVNSAGYVVNRLGRVREVKRTIAAKKAQARAFTEAYAGLLNDGDAAFLEAFARSRSGLFFYLKHMGLIHGIQRKLGFAALG
ncbi:MAG: glycosyltransferase family 2 protein [Clostridia bacterium]|nr:glycosyltransferase family 2 protein [Clostridia bacterium]